MISLRPLLDQDTQISWGRLQNKGWRDMILSRQLSTEPLVDTDTEHMYQYITRHVVHSLADIRASLWYPVATSPMYIYIVVPWLQYRTTQTHPQEKGDKITSTCHSEVIFHTGKLTYMYRGAQITSKSGACHVKHRCSEVHSSTFRDANSCLQ